MRRTSKKSASAVDRIAHALRAKSLAAEDGAHIGSEEGLSGEFDVSPPTLRQAARLLEHEGLLNVKRGVNGGYFADRPKLETITRFGATYLRASAKSSRDVSRVVEAITPLIVRSVVASDRLDELQEFIDAHAGGVPLANYAEVEGEFIQLVMNLTDNSVLQLMYAIFYQFGLTVPRPAQPPEEKRIQALGNTTMAMARALVAKDIDAALEHAARRVALITGAIVRSLDAAEKSQSDSKRGKATRTRGR